MRRLTIPVTTDSKVHRLNDQLDHINRYLSDLIDILEQRKRHKDTINAIIFSIIVTSLTILFFASAIK